MKYRIKASVLHAQWSPTIYRQGYGNRTINSGSVTSTLIQALDAATWFTRLDIRWRYAYDAVVFHNLVCSGTLVAPTLSVVPAGPDGLTVSWTPETPGFFLQLSQELIEWTDAAGATNPPVTLPIAEGEALCFRLTNP